MGNDIDNLIQLATNGDENALANLFDRYRSQLRGMIAFRMDSRLQGRVDPSDVLQEAYIDLAKKLPEFEKKGMSFFVWLRLVASERLLAVHRRHLGTLKRDARREVRIQSATSPESTSIILAEHLLGQHSSVAGKAIKAEQGAKLQAILDQMDEKDREIIALRIFEGLSNGETAEVLGLTRQTASKKFLRAIGRIRAEAKDFPGFDS